MNDHGPGSGHAGRRLLDVLDRLNEPVRAVENDRGNFQLEGRGHAYQWRTIARLIDAGLVKATAEGDNCYLLRFTAAGRELLGA